MKKIKYFFLINFIFILNIINSIELQVEIKNDFIFKDLTAYSFFNNDEIICQNIINNEVYTIDLKTVTTQPKISVTF